MRTEREQDRPSEPGASKAERGKRTPATREKLAEQLNELEATERVLVRYSKGARGRKTASARTPAAATKGETGKRTPATRTRSAPKVPGTQNEPQVTAASITVKGTVKTRPSDTQNEPEAAAAIEGFKSEAGAAIAAAAIEGFKSALQSASLKILTESESTAIEALKSWAAEDITRRLMLTGQAGLGKSGLLPQAPEEYELAADVDAILKRLDQGIAAEHAAMDRLLERIVSRTPR
jgi:hypothetical protein